jgi:signal transduction histidine kinase
MSAGERRFMKTNANSTASPEPSTHAADFAATDKDFERMMPEDRLSDASRHQLLRIAQEAIHNAVRHANPTLIDVTLRWHAPNLVLQVKDNGRGISADRLEKCEGFGLQNIRKRAREIGARFEIRTAVGQGTSITVTVPIP